MREYLERYFYGPESWTEYLSLIGMGELLLASQRGRSIYND
jgi:glutaconate CoA-transferase subunit A